MVNEKLEAALRLLCGDAGYPVCAADSHLQIRWQSGENAGKLTEKLRTVLGDPPQLPENGSILLTDGADALRCEISPVRDDAETLYLLRFLPAERSDALNRTESVLLLREQAALIHAAGTAILYAADRMNRDPDADGLPSDPAAREPFLSIQDHCYALLRQSLFDRELLWYENPAAVQPVTELRYVLRRFFGQTELLTERYLHAGVCELEGRLYAGIGESRLNFALTALLTETLRDIQGQNVLNLHAGREAERIRIELLLRYDPAYRKEPFPLSGRRTESASAASAGMLLERFCAAFGARVMRKTAEDGFHTVLELPAADAVGNTVRSDAALSDDSRFSVYHVMLSALIPAEVLMESDPSLW